MDLVIMIFRLIFMLCWLTTTSGSMPTKEATKCFALMSRSKCSKIQDGGDRIQKKVITVDELIRETVSRSINEGSKIMNTTLAFLKDKVTPMKITPPKVPIETSELQRTELNIKKVISTAVVTANHELHDVIVTMMETLTSGNDVVSKQLFSSKGIVGVSQIDTSGSKLGRSLDGIMAAASPEVQSIVVRMTQQIYDACAPLFNILRDSIKALLGNKVSIDFDAVSKSVSSMLKLSTLSLAISVKSRLSEQIGDILNELDGINGLTRALHSDAAKVKDGLEPAASLVREAIIESEARVDHSQLDSEVRNYVSMMTAYYADVKAIATS